MFSMGTAVAVSFGDEYRTFRRGVESMPNNNPQSQQQRSQESSSKLTDRIEKTAEQTTSAAIQRVRDAREQAASGLEHQRGQIADRIRRLGGVIRAGSETLSTDDPYAQGLLSSSGDRIEQLADYVENLTPGQLADDVQTFARQRPALFFGGTFLLGLGLGRFVKSSARVVSGATGGSQRSYETDYGGDRYSEESYTESDVGGSMANDESTSAQARKTASGHTSTSGTSGTTTGASYGSSGAGGTTLPYGVGSSSASTVTSGSSYGPGSGAQSGAAPGTAGVTKQDASGSKTNADTLRTQSGAPSNAPSSASTTPRETERGQGTKS
jgi:ElaB/YqjD/DUF883 family membrane-anchored ribosome-binding protein